MIDAVFTQTQGIDIPIGVTESGLMSIPISDDNNVLVITGTGTVGKTTLVSYIAKQLYRNYGDNTDILVLDCDTELADSDLISKVIDLPTDKVNIDICTKDNFCVGMDIIRDEMITRMAVCDGFGDKSLEEYNDFVSKYTDGIDTFLHMVIIIDNLQDILPKLSDEERMDVSVLFKDIDNIGRKLKMSLVLVNPDNVDDFGKVITLREIPGYAVIKINGSKEYFRFPY